jgi:hypothetical protein
LTFLGSPQSQACGNDCLVIVHAQGDEFRVCTLRADNLKRCVAPLPFQDRPIISGKSGGCHRIMHAAAATIAEVFGTEPVVRWTVRATSGNVKRRHLIFIGFSGSGVDECQEASTEASSFVAHLYRYDVSCTQIPK